MEGVVDQTLGARRFVTTIVSAFGALSVTLAALGVYGVLAYSVAQRRRELAVRLALGAQPGELRRMVLRDGLGAALPGLLGGAIAALALTRLIRALVVGVSPADPATYVAVASLLLGAALLASFVPARRATRVDPIMALRAD
jgi:ABC-type antimicrobial peptide transport system permease subunit